MLDGDVDGDSPEPAGQAGRRVDRVQARQQGDPHVLHDVVHFARPRAAPASDALDERAKHRDELVDGLRVLSLRPFDESDVVVAATDTRAQIDLGVVEVGGMRFAGHVQHFTGIRRARRWPPRRALCRGRHTAGAAS